MATRPPSQRLRDTLSRSLPSGGWLHVARGALAAVLGVAAVTIAIGLVQSAVHVGNLALIYLLVVLWLAATFGRGPALLASFLAFLAYDYFFIPPLHRLTVDDPAQWLALGALLATSLVLGQVTAAARARAHDAEESGQRTVLLYSLAQLLVSTVEPDALLAALAARVTDVFASAGVEVCAIFLPNAENRLSARAAAPPNAGTLAALDLANREHAALAAWAFERGAPAGGTVDIATPHAAGEYVAYYVPLRSSQRVVGVVGVGGQADVRRLVTSHAARPGNKLPVAEMAARDPQTALFTAFCDQIALTVDRMALEQATVHTEALRESDRLKNALLGSVTHDLRTPLAAIQAATGSLLEPGVVWSDADRHEFLDTIKTSADRLSRLVSNLLDLSQLEAGVAVPQRRWYPFADVIAIVLDRLELAGQLRGRQIELDLADDLPLLLIDHAQFEQVMTNLLENALKYSPMEPPIVVCAHVIEATASVEIRVIDRGIGIAPNELSAIFDKFYRVQHIRLPWAVERPPTGTGLGLAICAGIVQAHGGRIWAESHPGEGTTFVISLPLPPERSRGALPADGFESAGDAALSVESGAGARNGDAASTSPMMPEAMR
ncbi:MAG TPA: ATP-binding protein [Ktedonobacterales bacterium]|nr:ATP-binding protein [Ktedonobacterales bacterium]